MTVPPSSTDIVERLRELHTEMRLSIGDIASEAADEIERLRAQSWKYLQEVGAQARRADGVAQGQSGCGEPVAWQYREKMPNGAWGIWRHCDIVREDPTLEYRALYLGAAQAGREVSDERALDLARRILDGQFTTEDAAVEIMMYATDCIEQEKGHPDLAYEVKQPSLSDDVLNLALSEFFDKSPRNAFSDSRRVAMRKAILTALSTLSSTQNSPPVELAPQNSAERIPSSDAGSAGGEAISSTHQTPEAK